MWINKGEYNKLKELADNNERDANLFRKILNNAETGKVVHNSDIVAMTPEKWNGLLKVINSYKNNIRNLEAEISELENELEWYKVKYHETKEIRTNNVEECDHEWELMNICCDSFYVIRHYKCSKCGAETTKSIGI